MQCNKEWITTEQRCKLYIFLSSIIWPCSLALHQKPDVSNNGRKALIQRQKCSEFEPWFCKVDVLKMFFLLENMRRRPDPKFQLSPQCDVPDAEFHGEKLQASYNQALNGNVKIRDKTLLWGAYRNGFSCQPEVCCAHTTQHRQVCATFAVVFFLFLSTCLYWYFSFVFILLRSWEAISSLLIL